MLREDRNLDPTIWSSSRGIIQSFLSRSACSCLLLGGWIFKHRRGEMYVNVVFCSSIGCTFVFTLAHLYIFTSVCLYEEFWSSNVASVCLYVCKFVRLYISISVPLYVCASAVHLCVCTFVKNNCEVVDNLSSLVCFPNVFTIDRNNTCLRTTLFQLHGFV